MEKSRHFIFKIVVFGLLIASFFPVYSLADVILDNGDTGTSYTGTWATSRDKLPYGKDAMKSSEEKAIYTFESPITGNVEIFLWWPTNKKNCDVVSVQILDGGSVIDTVQVNQTINAGQWNSIGSYQFASSAGVGIWSPGGCETKADAVKFAQTKQILDIRISGPVTVDENTATTQYICMADYDDNTSGQLTPSWCVDDSSFAKISVDGILTTGNVDSDVSCEITATYIDGTEFVASLPIQILNDNQGAIIEVQTIADLILDISTDDANIGGSVTIDSVPAEYGVTSTWSKLEGPGDAIFFDANNINTTATFEIPGTYILQLWVTDGIGTAADTLTVTYRDQAKLTVDPSATEEFANSLDANGDTLFVGACKYEYNEQNTGSIQIFKRDRFFWKEEGNITLDLERYPNDEYIFGVSVASDGDHLIIGAVANTLFHPSAVGHFFDQGAAFIYQRNGDSWELQDRLLPNVNGMGREDEGFALSVDISGDYAIVGSKGDSENGGAAYIYKKEGSQWILQSKIINPDGDTTDYFANSVAINGDYAIIGEYNETSGRRYGNGVAHIYKRNGTSWIYQCELIPSVIRKNAQVGQFGIEVDIQEGYAAVSAYVPSVSSDPGSVYIFKQDAENWIEQAILKPVDTQDGDCFGSSLCFTGKTLTIGARGDSTNGSYTGAAYMFTRESDVWTQSSKFLAYDGKSKNSFGANVTSNKNYIFTTSNDTDLDGNEPGAVYISSYLPVNILSANEKIMHGTSTTLTWFSENMDSVTIEPGIGPVSNTGTIVVSPSETTTYTITGTNPEGAFTDSATIYILPGVSISAVPNTIITGNTTTLTWTSSLADSCTITPDVGMVDLNGSIEVSPVETTTYTITVTGSGGTSSAQVTVAVENFPQPNVNFTVEPANIRIGESTTLIWSSTDADTCDIQPDIGGVTTDGTINVSPLETTTYTITAIGPGGTDSAQTTVTVDTTLPPTVDINADNTLIQTGDSVTLTWRSTDALTCTISPATGAEVDLSGSCIISPTQTTTYTITANGPYETVSDTITIMVTDPMPTAKISSDKIFISSGGSATLTWSSRNADTVEIYPSIGFIGASGSLEVTPTQTTTYIIYVNGLGMTAISNITVCVGRDYNYGDPTSPEQVHLEAINQARANPLAEAARLGIDLNEGLTEGEISDTPVQPLTSNSLLLQAARLHNQDMLDNQFQSHQGTDGLWPADRISVAGFEGTTGENIGSVHSTIILPEIDSILKIHDNLFIDANVDGRGHRKNILYNQFKEIGVGAAEGSNAGYPYGYLVTYDLGASSIETEPFLTGVVYNDADSDEKYSAGEGIENVTIKIMETGIKVKTASAGGYGLILPSGSYTVQAILADGRIAEKLITISDLNIKTDFKLSEFNFITPEINLPADTVEIFNGNTALLSWSSENSAITSIDNGIGDVPSTGQISVSPSQTTTYTITTQNSEGGIASQTITITVKPIEIIDIEPKMATVGLLETFQFTAIGKDEFGNPLAVPINVNWSVNGGGTIDSNGLFTATSTGTFTVTAQNGETTETASVLITEIPIEVHITSPTLVEPIERPDIMVKGFVSGNDINTEFGVVVNGVPAIIYGNEFVANHVGLQEGENTISAVFTDKNGYTVTNSVIVYMSPGNYITINSQYESGLNPLETTLTISDDFSGTFSITASEITYDGPGTITFIESSPEEYVLIINGSGVYFITATVTGPGSNGMDVDYTDTVVIEVLEQSVIDAKLRSKWDGMKDALAVSNIENGVKYFTESSRDKFQEAFSIISESLPQIISDMQDIELIYSINWTTKYRIIRHQLIEGEYRDITYYIYFVVDNDGMWKISQF